MARVKKTDSRIQLLLDIIDQAYDKKAWHGTTLRGSIRGLTAKEALWRPAPGRLNIWELALHAAYWKYIVARKLSGDGSLSFPRKGSNFPELPKPPDATAWKNDVELLRRQHLLVRRAIAQFPARKLKQKAPKSVWTNEQFIYGIASHDLYHAGQIQLLKRLQRTKSN